MSLPCGCPERYRRTVIRSRLGTVETCELCGEAWTVEEPPKPSLWFQDEEARRYDSERAKGLHA